MAAQGSMRAVLTAVASNGLVTIAKFVGFAFSGSSALLAEAVHSLADTANQSLLFLGPTSSIISATGRNAISGTWSPPSPSSSSVASTR